jgi:hypothetical protein
MNTPNNTPATQLWWLSFAGEDGNLGCCIVEAPGFMAAITKTHLLGINPGGEVAGFSSEDVGPDGREAMAEDVKRWGLDRLITRAELIEAGGYVTRGGEPLSDA